MNIPEDIKAQAAKLRAEYLRDALGRMVLAAHEYQKSYKKVEETDDNLSQLPVKHLVSGACLAQCFLSLNVPSACRVHDAA